MREKIETIRKYQKERDDLINSLHAEYIENVAEMAISIWDKLDWDVEKERSRYKLRAHMPYKLINYDYVSIGEEPEFEYTIVRFEKAGIDFTVDMKTKQIYAYIKLDKLLKLLKDEIVTIPKRNFRWMLMRDKVELEINNEYSKSLFDDRLKMKEIIDELIRMSL